MKSLYDLTLDYERFFGDPADEKNTFSFKRARQYDINSTFPEEFIRELNAWGLSEYYVPEAFGGNLKGYDELFNLIRLTSRRDLTAAIGHGKTMLGAICVWVGGSDTQRARLAESILRQDQVSLALTEHPHGSDISATDTLCSETEDGYLLNGEKYLINNARRSASLTVFARTSAKNNARDFSLFMVEKAGLPENALSYEPKLLTHGIKGADISGVRFHNAPLPASSLVGQIGQGLEIMLCGFQISRTLCTALSCGAGESALRLTYRYAEQRRVYHSSLSQLANIRRRLSDSAADLLIADLVGLFSSRAINVLPQQMSTISAAAKAYVPASIETMVDGLVDVLGARAYLEDDGEFGHFSKLQRDCRLVSLFDGNTVVNLQALVVQLPVLARQRRRPISQQEMPALLDVLFSIDAPLEALKPEQLKLSGKGHDFIVQGLFDVQRQLTDVEGLSATVQQKLSAQVSELLIQLALLDDFFLSQTPSKQISAQSFAMAENYTRIFAGACCIQAFISSHRHLAAHWKDGKALCACLARLVGTPAEYAEPLMQQVQTSIEQHQLISFFPLPLAG